MSCGDGLGRRYGIMIIDLARLVGAQPPPGGDIRDQFFWHGLAGERVVPPFELRPANGPGRETAREKDSREPAITRVRTWASPEAVLLAHPAKGGAADISRHRTRAAACP